jgi:hypothetical protein
MKLIRPPSLGVLILMPVTAVTAAVDADKLHTARCTGCHDASLYTRPDRRVQSLEALRGQISACGHGSGQPLGAGERDAMTQYLNKRYYRFK